MKILAMLVAAGLLALFMDPMLSVVMGLLGLLVIAITVIEVLLQMLVEVEDGGEPSLDDLTGSLGDEEGQLQGIGGRDRR